MGNTWPFVRTASPSAPVIDGSVGLPHSWHSPSPGSARKTARSVRGWPSTCHYREEDHQKQLSWGPLVMQREVRNEEGWSVSAVAFQSAAASSAHCQDEGNSVPTPPPPSSLPTVGAVSGRWCSHLLSPALRQQSPRSTWGDLGCQTWLFEGILLQQILPTVFILNIL